MGDRWGPEARRRWCSACGAETEAPTEGGAVTCPRCATEASLAPWPSPEPPLSPGRPVGDTGALEGAPRYAFEAPRGLAELARGEERVERLKAAMVERLGRAERSSETARELYWIAVTLRGAAQAEDRPEEGYAALATAWDALDDDGYRHLLACNLAGLARRQGDLAAARDWLPIADPAPDALELDSDVRGERALLFLSEGSPEAALEQVGAPGAEAHCEKASEVRFGMVRASALASLGRPADAALDTLLAHPSVSSARLRAWLSATPAFAPALDAWRRRDPAAATGREPPRAAPTAVGFVILMGLGLAGLGLGIMGEQELAVDADWVPMNATVVSARGERYEYRYPSNNGGTRVGVGLEVHVRYRHGEPPIESDRYSLDEPARIFDHTRVDEGRAHLATLRPGAPLTVYVDPDDPREAVIARRDAAPRRGALASGVVLILLAFGVLALHRRQAARFEAG